MHFSNLAPVNAS